MICANQLENKSTDESEITESNKHYMSTKSVNKCLVLYQSRIFALARTHCITWYGAILHVLHRGVQYSVQFQTYILHPVLYAVSLGSVYITPFTIAVSSLSMQLCHSFSTSSSCMLLGTAALLAYYTAVGIMHISGNSCTNCAFDSYPFWGILCSKHKHNQ